MPGRKRIVVEPELEPDELVEPHLHVVARPPASYHQLHAMQDRAADAQAYHERDRVLRRLARRLDRSAEGQDQDRNAIGDDRGDQPMPRLRPMRRVLQEALETFALV